MERQEQSNRVLYLLAFVVLVIVAGAIVLSQNETSQPNLIAEEEAAPETAGVIQDGVYESTTVILRLPYGTESITGGQIGDVDSFVLDMDDGRTARYQGALLSGALSPADLARSYSGQRTKVAGQPAVLISSGNSARLIGTLRYYRFELSTTAANKKAAVQLALLLGRNMKPGQGE